MAAADFLIADIQGLRAPSRVPSVSRLLKCRGSARATLVVAAGPSDFVPLWEEHNFEASECQTIGEPVTSPQAQVRLVGADRLQAEREFEFALRRSFCGRSSGPEDYVARKVRVVGSSPAAQ